MAKKTKQSQLSKDIEEYVDRKIQEENIEQILGERFSRYSKYIILDRALPDARDGLKPVQRRILYAMYKLGMFPNKPYRKSARIVGEVIGKYHPHGDTSVYDAMIRMSQPFNNLLPLIDVHGNNGSIDGDGAAAMRYTEARLSKYAEFLLQDLNKKTVGFVPNFDDEELEPVVLPGKFPNLLVNGGNGISEGYATTIPPHNVDEILKASIYRLEHPNCSLDDILTIVKGPDFPGGAIIEGLDGIKQAYKTGRGKILVKSKLHDETAKNGNPLLVVSEIPYTVNKSLLVKQMADVAEKKNLDGVVDIRDESDREGLRVVIELKPDANKEVIKNFFFKYSQLACNFNFNMTVIIDKRPMTVGIIPLIDAYLNHQKDVLFNRSNYELVQAKKRLEIVDGLISMTSILDAVIQTIRSSKDKKDAKENLIAQYSFTETQAEAIVMLQLYRLTNTDVVALENEKVDLNDTIEYLNNILSNEIALNSLVKDEMEKTLEALSTPRRTEIMAEMQEIDISQEEILAKEDNIVYATRDGYLKRLTPKNDASEDENVVKEGDAIIATYHLSNLDTILFFTNMGNYVYLPVRNIPECKHKDIGYNISTLTSISASERIIYQMAASNFKDDEYILFTTKHGLVKRTPLSQLYAQRYSKALQATKLRDDDEVLSVSPQTSESQYAVFITQSGLFTKYDLNEISVMAVASYGMIGVTLPKGSENDTVIAGFLCNEKDTLVLLTSKQMKNIKVANLVTSKRTYTAKPILEESKTKLEMLAAQPFSPETLKEDPVVYLYGTAGHLAITLADLGLTKGKKTKPDLASIKKPQYYIIAKNIYLK